MADCHREAAIEGLCELAGRMRIDGTIDQMDRDLAGEIIDNLGRTILGAPDPKMLPRPAGIDRMTYLAMTPEEKADHKTRWQAYMAQFGPDDYPCFEQNTPGNQRYADGQRAEGMNPPGVYC